MIDKVTIVDVAEFAQVSTSTVSNFLNGRIERMRPSTRTRIEEAISQLGYVPNRTAQQLKKGHVSILGLIVPSVANPFFGAFARYVEEVALSKGYQVLLGNSDRNSAHEKLYAEELWSQGVRGIIFGSSLVSLTYLTDVVERGLHVMAIDRVRQEADRGTIDSVSIDNFLASRLAIGHLLSLGHRRIGFISGPIQTVNRLERLAGYRAALEEANIAFDPELICEEVLSSDFGDVEGVDLGRQGIRRLLKLANPPSAFFAINDMYAFGAYAGARDLGLQVPQDISIVGLDDIGLAEIITPALTTIRQPMRDMASYAVERIIRRIEGKLDEPSNHHILPTELVIRESTAPYCGPNK